MLYVISNILTEISKISNKLPSIDPQFFFGKIRLLPWSEHIRMEGALVVSAFFFLIGCSRTKRENTSTDTMNNVVLEFQEETSSTCAKSIQHISLVKRALTYSLGNLRRLFLNFV